MLKSLELFGFKSFADRTRFDLDPGITCVVGPNGSGKSNVVDGIKWLLGDQSPKSLRGKEMTDVIFSGSQGRKANSFAEALLTFDNSNGFLPIEAQEVQIGRRLWKNGDSEYLINRGTVRLKDIRDLFMGTGAGSSAYCIIEQGRVDQILQANASNRRAIFEEAAGVSRYKARRLEAERRLERVEQNLLRLTDIVDEVEAQLNSIRNQAQKATKYRDLSNKLKELWLGLAADDYRFHATQLRTLETQRRGYTTQVDGHNDSLKTCQAALTRVDAEISEIDDRLHGAERRAAANRESMASQEATVQHQRVRLGELDSDLSRLRRQQTIMASRTSEVQAELERTRSQLQRFESTFSESKTELADCNSEIAGLRTKAATDQQRYDAGQQHILDTMRESSACENRVEGLLAQIDAGVGESEALEQRRADILGTLENVRHTHDAQQVDVNRATEDVTAAEKQVREIKSCRQSLMGELDRFQNDLADKRETRSAWQARKSLLEDLELRQEGVGIGVKDILERARTLSSPPWNCIHGTVAELLDVDLERAALLEVALGDRAQLIVLDDFGALIDYLDGGTRQISGRVGFIACGSKTTSDNARRKQPQSRTEDLHTFEHFRVDAAELPDLSAHDGVEQRADRLVSASRQLPALPEQLLADTWVVDLLDTALDLSQGDGRGCRFVTLQGELLDSDGTLTVGTVRSETALVSRRSELRRLAGDLRRLDQEILGEERRRATIDESLGEADAELNSAKARLRQLSQIQSEQQAFLAERQREFESVCRDRDALDGEVTRFENAHDRLTTQLGEAQSRRKQIEQDLAGLQANVDSAQRDMLAGKENIRRVEEEHSAKQLDFAKQEERLEGLRLAARRIEDDEQQHRQQSDEARRRFDLATAKHREITLQILNTSAQLAELDLIGESFTETTTELAVEKSQHREQRASLSEEETSVRKQRRELSEEQHRVEIAQRDLQFQISALEKRIGEEYELTLADVVESGASAVKIWRAAAEAKDTTKRAPTDETAVELESVEEQTCDSDDDSNVDEVDELESADANVDTNADVNQLTDPFDADYESFRDDIEKEVNRLRRKIQVIGNVNTDSLHDLDEMEQRFLHLREQLDDLVEAKAALEDIIRRINSESKRLFYETFEAVRGHFQHLFRKAFGGGDGDIVLEDADDVLECGIDIVARPPGKELKSISLMSGGEKTLTAFALLLALFKSRPSPYCLLDEVDAALDEANVGRMVALIEEFKQSTQFIVITHKKPTMTIADVLYGVTMEQSGVSKRVSVRFEDVRENGEFASTDSSSSAGQTDAKNAA